MKSKSLIQATDIRKSFGDLEILKGITLEVSEGEIVAIIGSSGAGKTTLLQILSTLDSPDSGHIVIDGIEIGKLSEEKQAEFRNQKIGFVFQSHQLLPEFSAEENVAIPGMIGGMSLRQAKEKATNLLESLNLSDRLHHKPSALSGGEKQRVAVARALINDPKIIFADEPSGALDSGHKEELHRIIKDLRDRDDRTFVIVTHDDSLSAIADRVLRLKDGRIIGEEEGL